MNIVDVNWGARCPCQAERVNICTRCEKEQTGIISQIFGKTGYLIDFKYCEEHVESN